MELLPLKKHIIASILENPDKTRLSSIPPVNPTGGMVFVYINDDWKADGYNWSNRGNVLRPTRDKNVKLQSTVYYIRKRGKKFSAGFKRTSYTFSRKMCGLQTIVSQYALVHYLGDCSLNVPKPHGNCRTDMIYKRRAPSLQRKDKDKKTIASHKYTWKNLELV